MQQLIDALRAELDQKDNTIKQMSEEMDQMKAAHTEVTEISRRLLEEEQVRRRWALWVMCWAHVVPFFHMCRKRVEKRRRS